MAIFYKHWLKLLWVAVLALVFFPVAGLIAQFCGLLSLAAAAFELSPRWLISQNEVERISYEAAGQNELREACQEVNVGRLRFRLPADEPVEDWVGSTTAVIDRLAQLLPGSPPLPAVEMRELFDTYGRFDNPFTLGIDFEGEEPLRTAGHELAHLYLLWAMIPGLPVDCPRWLNEGLSEYISGEPMGDDTGWSRYAMIRERNLVDLHVVSPAFSWPGPAVEWHAREATALLIELHGEAVFLQMINGLRLARPFYSVYPIITGRPLEKFEFEWKERFSRQRVLENLPVEEVSERLTWLADNRGILEVQPLLQDLPERYLTKDMQKHLIDRARMHGARVSFGKGNLRDGLGWLRGVNHAQPGYEAFRTLIAKARAAEFDLERLEGESLQKRPSASEPWRPNRSVALLAWLVALGSALLLVAVYSNLRAPIVAKLRESWQLSSAGALVFRWSVLGLTGLGGSWFLRFLVISMIPYGGLAALPDLYRILLAETLVIILWLALSWQLRRWESQGSGLSRLSDSTTDVLLSVPVKCGTFVVFLVAGTLPPLLAAWQAGWQPVGFGLPQILPAVLLFLAGSAAFGTVTWTAARLWHKQFASRFAPALIYAMFRGGLAADPYGSLFALAAGWWLSGLAQRSRHIWPVIMGDMLLCGPAFLLCTSWFPACDPVAGYWYGGSAAVIWWLPAAVILLLFRDAGQENGRQG
ncbi:MAG: hypothetical protein CVV41_00255 [Candidatus Riflebacteria bacterium HGW-Riflebacteria-1]|nr:MAG: hypothetical protein CVV41_00255 [Candidatus Riflebacteria bacterium HGW-Riflebacteria-1]